MKTRCNRNEESAALQSCLEIGIIAHRAVASTDREFSSHRAASVPMMYMVPSAVPSARWLARSVRRGMPSGTLAKILPQLPGDHLGPAVVGAFKLFAGHVSSVHAQLTQKGLASAMIETKSVKARSTAS